MSVLPPELRHTTGPDRSMPRAWFKDAYNHLLPPVLKGAFAVTPSEGSGLAYPADRAELDPADIRIYRISRYPADIRRSWWSWGASTGASVGRPESVGSVERVWSIFGWIQNKLRSKILPRHRQEASDGAHVAEDGGES